MCPSRPKQKNAEITSETLQLYLHCTQKKIADDFGTQK